MFPERQRKWTRSLWPSWASSRTAPIKAKVSSPNGSATGPNAEPASAIGGAPTQQLPPLLQSLGAAPLAQGLSDLLKDFQQKGFGETIKSWVETGPNKPVSTGQLEQALGEEKIAWLLKQTGMSREALLEGLSRELPPTIDHLTPDGRLPTEQETMQRLEAPKSKPAA